MKEGNKIHRQGTKKGNKAWKEAHKECIKQLMELTCDDSFFLVIVDKEGGRVTGKAIANHMSHLMQVLVSLAMDVKHGKTEVEKIEFNNIMKGVFSDESPPQQTPSGEDA